MIGKFDMNRGGFVSIEKDGVKVICSVLTSDSFTNFSEVLFCRKHTQNFTASNLVFPKKQIRLSGISVGTSSNYSFESARFFNYSCHTNSLSNDVFLATDDSLCPIYFNNGVESESVRAKCSSVNGKTSSVNGKTSSVNGKTSYVNGKTSYVNGKTSYVNGKTSYVNGKTSYVNGKGMTTNGKAKLTINLHQIAI